MKRLLPIQKGILVLLIALFAGMGTAYAYTFSKVCSTGQILYYNITDATNHYVEITYPGTSTSNPWGGYTKPTGNITLPSSVTYNGYTYYVKAIGECAFYTCSGLTGTLTIPSSVTSISDWAFYGCSGFTGSLTIGNSVTSIGIFAFSLCSGFTGTLTLGNSLATIGNYAFQACTHFTGSLTIPNSVTSIGTKAFMNCTSFTGTLTIGTSVTSMGERAFHNCSGITQLNYNAINCADVTYEDQPFEGCGGTLTIGNTVQKIPAFMFFQCTGLTGSLSIPNSVTTIGQNAFYYCAGFSGTLSFGSSLTTIGSHAFYNCSGFTGSLSIPNSVTTINICAFRNCTGFTGTLNIGTGVTSIGYAAFGGCSGFTHVSFRAINCADVTSDDKPFEGCGGTLTFGMNVQRIPAFMFYNCSGFTGALEIKNSITSIGDYAFYNCSGFNGTLIIGLSITSIGQSAFKNCTGFVGVDYRAINCANVDIGTKPFEGCHGTLTIGSFVQRIPACMFYYCTGFTGTLTIPNSVTSIGYAAFIGCSGFTGTLTIPDSVTSIDGFAFNGCSGFTGSLTIPNSVTSIGEFSFYECTGFTGSLTIGSSVTTISRVAFMNCTGFTGTLTIPTSVTLIGADAFTNCSGFTHVSYNAVNCADVSSDAKPFAGCGGTLTIGSSVQRIPACIFNNCTGFTGSLTIPNSVTSIGNSAFDGCNGFNGALTIGSSVTAIGDGAFQYCSGLTGALTIPNSVTSIGDWAFYNCAGLTGSLTIPSSVTTIGQSAFCLCSGFTGALTIPDSVLSIGGAAFAFCSGFTGSLTIPDSVTVIEMLAFGGCSGFTNLIIPYSVTLIDQYAFAGCTGLTSMTVFPETPPIVNSNAFNNVTMTIPVYVPCGSLEDYQEADGWSAFTNMQCHETLTVYDGSSTSYTVPAYISYFDAFTKSQFVIPANDLMDAGTPISSMTFYTTNINVPYTTVSSADVYLKEVSYTEISSFVPKASATTVYSGYFDIVSTGNGGEMTINFSTPYTYNGGNLLVGIENTESEEWKEIRFYGQTVYGASIAGYDYSSLGNVQPVQQNFIPKTTFVFTPSPCSRPLQLTASDISSNSAVLNWTGFQDEYDVRYKTPPLFFEDFEHGLPEGWTTIDNDGDGYNWLHYNHYSHSGSYVMASESWHEGTVLTPDNWLITSQLELQGFMKVWLRALDIDYPDEHFAIYLSTTGNSVSDFTTVLVPETTTTSVYASYTADLRAYAGQQGYIAIRHFNCTDMNRLIVDDFGIFNDPDADEWVLALSTNNQLFIDNLMPNTEYEWQVRGRNCDGSGTYTGWRSAHSFTTKCGAFVVDADNPFTEDFEGEDFAPACWENIPSGNHQWSSSTGYSHSSSHSAYSGWYGDIYLVLPDLELSADAEAAQLSFWSYNTYPDDFTEGNNTVVLLDGGTETVLWSAETVSREWVETIVDLTTYIGQTITLAFKYAGDNDNGWYVDDVEVSVTPPSTVTQSIALSSGTNWVSFYVNTDLDALKAALEPIGGSTTDPIIIQANGMQTLYNGTRWRGALNALNLAQMYKITVPIGCEIELEGMPLNPAELQITIKNGANWIGFPFQQSMTVTEAFAGLPPMNGDVVRTKSGGQATYTNRWRGALNELVPGVGYIYNSAATEDKVFTFPVGTK